MRLLAFPFNSFYSILLCLVAREYYEEAEHHNPILQDFTPEGIACLAQDREGGDLEEAASLWRSIVERASEDEDFVFPSLGTLEKGD
jgi:hypothetical protein